MSETAYEGIVILGSPRSGTTLLRRMVDAHPRIHCPPETNLLRACARFLREEPMSGGLAVGVRTGLAFSGVDEAEIVGRLRELAFGIFRGLAQKAGKPLWAEKTAFDAFYVDEIETLCASTCRFICVLRHGLDVAISMQDLCAKMQMYPSELHDYIRRSPWPLEAFTTAWNDVSIRLQALVRAHPDRCLEVRYEDLVSQPEEQLERICEFLGEPADVSALLAAAPRGTPGLGDWKTYQTVGVSDQSVGRWRTLAPDVLARLGPLVNPGLERLGYPRVDAPAPVTAEMSRRTLQLSLLAAGLKSGSPKSR